MNRTNLCSSALRYASLGWHVLPLNEGSKTPATTNGHKAATNDPVAIRNWFSQGSHNLGIATGPSGLVVLDVDGPAGRTSLDALQAGRPLPTTYTVETRGANGLHIYFLAPNARIVRCSAGRLGTGLDVRAHGGYVVAPPSWVDADHKGQAGFYSVLVDAPVAAFPQWLEELLTQEPCSADTQSVRRAASLRKTRPETPRELAILRHRLGYISADCSYETYRNVVWAILSTGWNCAEELALWWSKTAPHRFDQKTFDTLVLTFDPDRPDCVTYGTLVYLSKRGGCLE